MKKKIAKIAFIMLSIVFALSTCMTVFAVTFKSVTESQNGIEATLNFNKQEYNANENVEVTLNVKNNNSYAVKNIQTELIVPSTIKLSKGILKQETFSLNAGESKVQEVALEKVVETNNEPTTNIPQTGDNVVVYIAMMVISAVALIFISVNKKWIHKKKVMSLVLCFTLVGAMTLTSVVNAEPIIKELTVEGTIKYDGEDVVIKGKVTYNYEVYSKVQIDGVDKGMYAEGNTVTITAEDAPEGKHFAGWTVVKGNVTLADANSSTTTFVMGKEDVEIKSNYEVNTYTIDVTLGENGRVTPEGKISVKHGESKQVTITANEGYHIESLESSGRKYQNTLGNDWKSFTIDYNNVGGNYYVKAEFAIDTFAITASVNDSSMGTITETGNVNYGDSKTFTMTANNGYGVKDVKVDGSSVGPVTSYTFENVNKDYTIEVEFANATTVTTAQQFRTAVTQDGIIILANDITLDDNGNVEISKNVIIHGNGHSVFMPRYSDTSHTVSIKVRGSALVFVENCNFKELNGRVTFKVEENSILQVHKSNFDGLDMLGKSVLLFTDGSISRYLGVGTKTSVSILGGKFGETVNESWDMILSEEEYEGNLEICGGTYYFDPTSYLDTDKYKATQTKDADIVDIWIVKEK